MGERRRKDITRACARVYVCVCTHNFKQSPATRSSDVAPSPARESERAMIDAGANGHAGRRDQGVHRDDGVHEEGREKEWRVVKVRRGPEDRSYGLGKFN